MSLRGHALLAAAMLAAALALLAPSPAAARKPPLQALERVRTIDFELPDGVGLINGGAPELAPDNRHLMIRVTVDGNEQVALTDLHGNGYRCLTCDVAGSASKAKFFDDGKRIFFGNTSGQTGGNTSDFQWSVLECGPSVYACDDREVLPVDFPLPGLPAAQNREADPEIGGRWIGWNEVRSTEGTRVTIGRLRRTGDSYTIDRTRVVNPQFDPSGSVDDFVDGGRFYEGGDQVLGGRYFKYQTTTSALNYDTWLLDFKTGKRKPLTTDLDYNEIADYGPGGRWAYYSSARGLDRMDVFTQLVRPPFIDMVSFGQIGRVALSGNRYCMNEGWLMKRRAGQVLGGYAGQPTLLADDWSLRGWKWFPSGRRAVVTETRIPNQPEPADEADRQRVSIVRLPGVRRTEPLEEATLDELPWKRYTIPADDYQGMSSRQIANKVIAGRSSGTATVQFSGTFAAGSWQVSFDEYSDDGRSFVNGTESLTTPNPIVASVYDADLTVRGEHNGFLRATVEVGPQNRFQGDAESEVDGNHLQGIPQQDDCPGLQQAELKPRLLRLRRARRGGRIIRVKVRSRVPEDHRARPVKAVRVLLGRRARRLAKGRDVVRTRTDRRGIARLRVPARARGPFRVTARSDGFDDGHEIAGGSGTGRADGRAGSR